MIEIIYNHPLGSPRSKICDSGVTILPQQRESSSENKVSS